MEFQIYLAGFKGSLKINVYFFVRALSNVWTKTGIFRQSQVKDHGLRAEKDQSLTAPVKRKHIEYFEN